MLRWLTTPAEPRGRYLVYTAALGVAFLSFSGAIWPDRGPLGLLLAVLACAAGGSVAAKLILGAGGAPGQPGARPAEGAGDGADGAPDGPGEEAGPPAKGEER